MATKKEKQSTAPEKKPLGKPILTFNPEIEIAMIRIRHRRMGLRGR
jgi:hypothetical protein